ncbi:MAG TPA: hypothetical protein VFH68_24040 [Polyangia bacterium]|nr:hypothetical protein [Polyangia bacterium]
MRSTPSPRLGALALGLALFIGASRARAAPAWIFRGLTLPRGDVALDLGLGLAHEPMIDDNRSVTGTGMNLEIAFGVSHELELGLRTGARFGSDGEVTQADRYGRPFDTETYGTNGDPLANPELRLLWAAAQGSIVKLGLELRAYLPIENRSRFGFMFALPLRLRLGAVRIDSGVYVPVILRDPTQSAISFPLHIWLQASRTLWLGPLLGVLIANSGGGRNQYPLGFGLGLALAGAIDLRTWILFPDISGDAAARRFGAGVALQIRFE